MFAEEKAVPEQTSWKIDDVANWLRQSGLQQCILSNVSYRSLFFDVVETRQLSGTMKSMERDYFTWLNLQNQI
jgi:hypothetical protein